MSASAISLFKVHEVYIVRTKTIALRPVRTISLFPNFPEHLNASSKTDAAGKSVSPALRLYSMHAHLLQRERRDAHKKIDQKNFQIHNNWKRVLSTSPNFKTRVLLERLGDLPHLIIHLLVGERASGRLENKPKGIGSAAVSLKRIKET